MVSPENTSSLRSKNSHILDFFLFLSGAMLALLLVWTFFILINPNPDTNPNPNPNSNPIPTSLFSQNPNPNANRNPEEDPPTQTFYDDPSLSYSIDDPFQNWDQKRRQWLLHHPQFGATPKAQDRIVVVTGSQPDPCPNPIGDHLLLRLLKNKLDYCRIHGYDIVYNNILLHPKMHSYWAKIPAIRSAMVAHPEAEWILWVDSDAAFTDMDFRLPLHRYKNHNLILHGWEDLVYQNKSWVSINAGVLLVRNCQWTFDFMSVWSQMGPKSDEYEKWGERLRAVLKDKLFPESDDQSGIVYLLLMEKEKWADKIYLENEYYFEGYWVEIVGRFQKISTDYSLLEKSVPVLRRRHAEKVSTYYGELREDYVKDWGIYKRRPFITHFTGCQPCSGNHNEIYSAESCWDGMRRALNFADDQVLRNYGFMHDQPFSSSHVSPVPFDYPA